MKLTRYLPSAWWRKRHCPEQPESWEFSPHSDVLLYCEWTMTQASLCIQRWDQNRNKTCPESQPVGKTALHEDWETFTGRHTTATTNRNMLIRAWPRNGPQSSPRAYWHQSQSRDSWISPLSRASVRYSIVSLEMFSAVQGQLHNAISLWMVEKLFIRALCDKGRRKKKTKLVFFCDIQRQYFAGSKFKTHGLLRWAMY